MSWLNIIHTLIHGLNALEVLDSRDYSYNIEMMSLDESVVELYGCGKDHVTVAHVPLPHLEWAAVVLQMLKGNH